MAALFQLVPMMPAASYMSPVAFEPSLLAEERALGTEAMLGGGAPTMPQVGGPMLEQSLMGELVGLMSRLMMGQQTAAQPPATAPATDTSSSGSSGDSSSSGSASGSLGSAGGATTDPSQIQGGSGAGKTLASAAEAEANKEHSVGYCYRGVCNALHSIGVNCSGEAAYMAADQLAHNPRVKEVKVDRSQLKSLPPGAIVVWDKGPGHPYGHISVALGGGREASDHVQDQVTDLTGSGDSFRVFMPV